MYDSVMKLAPNLYKEMKDDIDFRQGEYEKRNPEDAAKLAGYGTDAAALAAGGGALKLGLKGLDLASGRILQYGGSKLAEVGGPLLRAALLRR
jgi:hypothetical protein